MCYHCLRVWLFYVAYVVRIERVSNAMKLRKRDCVFSVCFVTIAIGICAVVWAGCGSGRDSLLISASVSDAREDERGTDAGTEPTDVANESATEDAAGDVNGKADVTADTVIPEAGHDVIDGGNDDGGNDDGGNEPLWTPCDADCESGQTCYLNNNEPGKLGKPECRSTGNTKPGERCFPWTNDDCIPGYTSWDNVCVKFCRTDADCVGDKADPPCLPAVYWDDNEQGWKTSQVSICSRTCNPLDPKSCGNSNVACDVREIAPGVFICRGRVDEGVGGEKHLCDWFAQCLPGYTCKNSKRQPGCPGKVPQCGTCYQWCLGNSMCPQGTTFKEHNPRATVDGEVLGWCQPNNP